MNVPEICEELQAQQRRRAGYIKSRLKVHNAMLAMLRNHLGYYSRMEDKSREEIKKMSIATLKAIQKGEETRQEFVDIVLSHQASIVEFEKRQKDIEKPMRQLAKQLPVYEWVQLPDQKGFGLMNLAVVLGETGDLANYSNPGKVWKRLGCAPYEKNGVVRMGSTWARAKTGPKLTKEEWSKFGYSPQRRSVAYNVGEPLLKSNGDGPYRQRYIDARVRAFETHPEWSWNVCTKCNNDPDERDDCKTCGGTGHKCMQAHRHGMLLATKLLLKNLWIEWNPERTKAGMEPMAVLSS